MFKPVQEGSDDTMALHHNSKVALILGSSGKPKIKKYYDLNIADEMNALRRDLKVELRTAKAQGAAVTPRS